MAPGPTGFSECSGAMNGPAQSRRTVAACLISRVSTMAPRVAPRARVAGDSQPVRWAHRPPLLHGRFRLMRRSLREGRRGLLNRVADQGEK